MAGIFVTGWRMELPFSSPFFMGWEVVILIP
jgi:hypothetical protein